jgi:uncharacterized protein YbjQ (UPF0145 family)
MGLLDSLLGGKDNGGDDEADRRRDEDVARVEGGSIPLAAERRMRALAGGASGFTSGLSVADFALCRETGVRPVAQVMGSSVYQVGWQNYPWGMGSWGMGWQPDGLGFELETLSEAWNTARSRALHRLAEEAELAGCHAVVDVTFEDRRHDFLDDEIEIVVNGTAVVLDGEPPVEGRPVLTDLSMPDFVLLRRAGYDAVGVVAATSVLYIMPGAQTQRLTRLVGQLSQPNQELTDYTVGLYAAREQALARANQEAWRNGATAIVGLSLDRDIAVREVDQNTVKREDLIVTFHVIGTGIVQRGEHRRLEPGIQPVVRQGAARS